MKGILAHRGYLIAAVVLVLLAIGIFVTLSAIKKPQELRKKAAVPPEQGSATVTLSPPYGPFVVGQPATVVLNANIQMSKVDGFQIIAYFAGDVPANLSFTPATISGMAVVKSAIEDLPQPTGDPYAPSSKLTLAYITENPDAQYPGTGIPVELGNLSFTPQTSGAMQMTYDQTLSKIIRSDKTTQLPNDQVKDLLIYPENKTLAFIIPATPTPIPTFSNLSATFLKDQATFQFSYSGAPSFYRVHLSTNINMTYDVYGSFGQGYQSPIIVNNPTKWDKYSCGRLLFWAIQSDVPIQSQVQSATVTCPTPTPTPTPNPTVTNTPVPTPSFTPTPTPQITCINEDINRDGYVDSGDYKVLLENFFSTSPSQPRADINRDGIVDLTDYSMLVVKYDPNHQHGTPGCQ